MSVEATSYEVQDVGKTIKSSKKKHTWRIKLDQKDYQID